MARWLNRKARVANPRHRVANPRHRVANPRHRDQDLLEIISPQMLAFVTLRAFSFTE
jgi:hypothetical protein